MEIESETLKVKMSEAIFKKDYEVNTFTTNPAKRLGVLGLVGILQDIAAIHAEKMGFGYDQMLERGSFWVLARQSIHISHWPELFSPLEVRTWSREPKGFNAYREFEILSGDQKIADCTTTWVALDVEKRRPVEIRRDNLPFFPRTEGLLDYEAKKLMISREVSDLELRGSFATRNSDLDLNGHVNNTKFSQWVIDSIPFERHTEFKVTGYHINFLSEVKLDDEVIVFKDLKNSTDTNHVFVGFSKNKEKPAFIVEIETE